jgi:hypothetical protein
MDRPPAAEHVSMKGLLSPGLHQLAGAMAFHVEMPAMSPRLQQPGLVMSDAAAGVSMDLQRPSNTTAAFNQPAPSGSPAAAVKADPDAPQEPLQQAARMPVPLWGMPGQHAGQADQSYAAAAASAGAFAAHQHAMQQWQQQAGTEQLTQPWFLQHHASTAMQQGAGRSGGKLAADAPASAPRTAPQQPGQPQSQATPGLNTAGGCSQAGGNHQDSTNPGGLPSSLLAAMGPLPGCPGHASVDSILRQIEAGAQTPRSFAAAAGGLGGSRSIAAQAGADGIGGQMFPRISLSTLLDPPSMLHHGCRPSQVCAAAGYLLWWCSGWQAALTARAA